MRTERGKKILGTNERRHDRNWIQNTEGAVWICTKTQFRVEFERASYSSYTIARKLETNADSSKLKGLRRQLEGKEGGSGGGSWTAPGEIIPHTPKYWTARGDVILDVKYASEYITILHYNTLHTKILDTTVK